MITQTELSIKSHTNTMAATDSSREGPDGCTSVAMEEKVATEDQVAMAQLPWFLPKLRSLANILGTDH